MRSHGDQKRIVILAAGVATACLGLSAVSVWAGGNIQFRNPANLSEVFDKTWDDRMLPITWVLSDEGLPGSGIDNATLTSELTAAFDTWEALPTSRLDFEFGGEVPISATGLEGPLGSGIDGRNLITFTDPGITFPPGVLAVAITFSFSNDTVIDSSNSDLDGDSVADIPEGTYPAGTIFDGDIAFNSGRSWEISGLDGTIDIRAVALHEIGHFCGLAHTMIRDGVMWPFLSNEISAARTLKTDDIAYASFYYKSEPAYSSTFGTIQGQIINGFSNYTVLGAHVYAVDPSTGEMQVGAYSGDDGRYAIPGLAGGNYLVAIEPLDGDPVGLDPFRVNEVVQFTFDTGFPDEFYDENESNIEADPMAGLLVAVAAGADSTGIDLITNTVALPGVNVILDPGYNLFAYPVEVPADVSAFDLLQALGDGTEINSVDRFHRESSTFERAQYRGGSPAGVDFPIRRGEGYVVHMAQQKVINFPGRTDCPDLDLSRGLNLVGVPCPPAGYTSFRLLQDIGERFEIENLQRYDGQGGVFEVSAYDVTDVPIGDDFPVSNGRGYIVNMLADKAGLAVPPPGSNFPPTLTGLSPGQGVPGTIVVILGEGFDPDVTKNTVNFNGIGASVVFATSTTLTVTVPPAATTGLVRVSVKGLQSNGIQFDVQSPSILENPGGETPIVSGQTADGMLTVDGEQDRYTFTALEGSLVTVSATPAVAGVPDLVLLLEDPFGVAVATDDNSGPGVDPRINNFELTSTGVHTVVVSNIPGSGIGSYQVSLTVTPRATEPKVSILGGNFQTGLGGSTLPDPLTVLVTGATGAPVAGSSVTFVATDATFGGSMVGPASYGTTVMATNGSGIVQVDTTLPTSNGTYTITVTVPGAPPATFTVAATDTPVATVEISGDQQTGTVNQPLANPLEVVLKDSLGGFVGGALVAFKVVSGGGSVSGTACENNPAKCFATNDQDGRAATTYTLGKKIDEPQLVLAYVPARPPIMFEATPEAGAPDRIDVSRTHFSRITLGTSALNAIQIQVFDEFNNPVEGAAVSHNPGGGLIVSPGLGPNGEVFVDNYTNENGLHVAAVSALAGVTPPTIDEFENDIPGPSEYTVTASVNGLSANFSVDVDMGPDMVTASGQNVPELIGQPLPGQVQKLVLRWERNDPYLDADSDGYDDDFRDFTNDPFTSLHQIGVDGVTINLEVVREDGRDEAAAGYTPLTISANQITTDGDGYAGVDVTTMGDIGGVKLVIGRIDSIFIEWFLENGSPLNSHTFRDQHRFGESTNLVAVPVVITVDLDDTYSGIDFSTVVASLNGTVFFNAAAPPAVLPDFPEKLQVIVGGSALSGLNSTLINDSAYHAIQLVYHPAAPRLITGANTVEVQVVKDNAENEQDSSATHNFSYP